MKQETLSSDSFERARKKAAGNPELLELIDWVEIQVSIGVSSCQAAATWAARKGREPLVKLDDALAISNIVRQANQAEELQ
jgi:hypothetical protein